MTWTTSRQLARIYDLPRATTAEIIAEATRRVLLRSGGCWTLLVLGLVAAAGLARALRGGPGEGGIDRFALVIGVQVVLICWHALGHGLAQPLIHAEASRRAARVHPERAA